MKTATPTSAPDRAPTVGGAYPLVGHLPRMRRDPLGLLRDASPPGGFSWLDLGPRGKTLLITHPDGVKHVLLDRMSNYGKQTRGFHTLRAFLGQGLLTSEGTFWRKQRRIAQPAFHHGRIRRFQAVMSRAADDLGDRWESALRAGRALDVADDMMQVTLRIVGECLFSTDPSHESSVIGPPVDLLLRKFIARISAPIVLPLNWPTPGNREVRNAIDTLRGVVDEIVAARRREPSAGVSARADLLQMLLEARDEETGEGMSASQLRDEVLTLLVAGHETTAAALAWSWILLAQHPDVDSRLETELCALPDAPSSLADLERAPLVGRVIQEAMRMYPPAWIVARHVVEDDTICGIPVKSGGMVILSPYASHRRAAAFPDPERFDPDRFDPARGGHSKFEYFPFGGGPRICIGNGFALMEAQLVLARLRRRFRLRLAAGARPEPHPLLTLRVKDGLRMRAEPVR